jgi:FKBP-type peptidyl-prolyl cis-trans isomerase
LLDGTVFDERKRPDVPADFRLNEVVEGWTEGIPKLQKGGKGLFIIPSRLGYKDKAQSSIPANSILVFEVELVEFTN